MSLGCVLFANIFRIAIVVKFVDKVATIGQQVILEVTVAAKLDNDKQFTCVI